MIDETFKEKVDKLSAINQNVGEYINSEYYLSEFISVDDISEQHILLKCYNIFLDDLEKIGIFFYNCSDILSNFYDAESIVWLYSLLSPTKMMKLFSENKKVVLYINDFLDSVNDNEFIVSFLEMLSNLYLDNEEYSKNFTLLHDKINSDRKFKDYILKLLNIYRTFYNNDENIDIKIPDQLKKFFQYYKAAKDDADIYINKLKDIKELDIDKISFYFHNHFLKSVLIVSDKLSAFSLYYSIKNGNDIYNFENQLKEVYKEYYLKYINESYTHPFIFKHANIPITINNIAIMAIGTIIEDPISPYSIEKVIENTKTRLDTIDAKLSSYYDNFIELLYRHKIKDES